LLLTLLDGTKRLSYGVSEQARDCVEPDLHHGAARIESKLAASLTGQQRNYNSQATYCDYRVPEDFPNARERGQFHFANSLGMS
jgi:hypothetical protein